MTSVESVLLRRFFLIPHCVIPPQPSHRHIVQLIMRFRLFSPLWCSAHLSVSKPIICSTKHKHPRITLVRLGKYQEQMKWKSVPYWYSVSLYCQCRGHHDILATAQKEYSGSFAQWIYEMRLSHRKCIFCVLKVHWIEDQSVSRVWRRFPGGASVNNQEQRVGWGDFFSFSSCLVRMSRSFSSVFEKIWEKASVTEV